MHGVNNIKFAHIFKISKKVQRLQRTSCIQRRNRTKLETFEHLTMVSSATHFIPSISSTL